MNQSLYKNKNVSKNHTRLLFDKTLIDLFLIKTGIEEQFYWMAVKRIESELVIKTRQYIMIVAEKFKTWLLIATENLV